MLDKYLNSASADLERRFRRQFPGFHLVGFGAPRRPCPRSAGESVDDVVTIIVTETINAAASGASTTERASSANASITSLAGPKPAAGRALESFECVGRSKA